jgi:hypothetical protein
MSNWKPYTIAHKHKSLLMKGSVMDYQVELVFSDGEKSVAYFSDRTSARNFFDIVKAMLKAGDRLFYIAAGEVINECDSALYARICA